MKFAKFSMLGLALASSSVFAQGAVYRCLDENGRPQYTNVKTDTDGKRCTVVTREVSVVPIPAASQPAAAPRTNTASAAPTATRSDSSTPRSREDTRRKILEDELAQEERALEKAKQELAQQESERSGNERNYQRVLDRLKPFQDTVSRHERNIAALKKELSNVR